MKNRDTDLSRRVAVMKGSWSEVLPSEVSERLVRVSHTMRVLTLGVGNAFFLVGRKQFVSQFQMRRATLLVTYCNEDPTDREFRCDGQFHPTRRKTPFVPLSSCRPTSSN